MNALTKALQPYADQLGQKGIRALSDNFDLWAEKADEPWKNSVLNLISDSIAKHGPEGLQMAQEGVEGLLGGNRRRRQLGTKVKLSDLTDDLETASDLLSALQNAEADRKKAARGFLHAVGQTLAIVSQGFLKRMLA